MGLSWPCMLRRAVYRMRACGWHLGLLIKLPAASYRLAWAGVRLCSVCMWLAHQHSRAAWGVLLLQVVSGETQYASGTTILFPPTAVRQTGRAARPGDRSSYRAAGVASKSCALPCSLMAAAVPAPPGPAAVAAVPALIVSWVVPAAVGGST